MREKTFDFYIGALTDQIVMSVIRGWLDRHPGIAIKGFYRQFDRPRELFSFTIYYQLYRA